MLRAVAAGLAELETVTPTENNKPPEAGPEPLLPRIASGDGDAVDLCLQRYGALVWSVARRFLAQEADAEDAVQDIFAELWSRADRFDPAVASEKTWVLMIARRRLIDRRRRDGRRPATATLEIEPTTSGPAADDREDVRRAKAALETLRPEQRQVLTLVLTEGYSHSAVAEKLGMPLGTVKTHARRGLASMREMLGVTRDDERGGANR